MIQGHQLTVQRLSSEESRKAQKYARVGPREFVPIDKTEGLTIDAIKVACKLHFTDRVGSNMECDILAGEQGPSCNNVDQIPNLKLIHVRFGGKRNDSPTFSGTALHDIDHCMKWSLHEVKPVDQLRWFLKSNDL